MKIKYTLLKATLLLACSQSYALAEGEKHFFVTAASCSDGSNNVNGGKKCTDTKDPKCKTIHPYSVEMFTKTEGGAEKAYCGYKSTIQTSSNDNYKGDCFKVYGEVIGTTNGQKSTLTVNSWYSVTKQEPGTENLTVYKSQEPTLFRKNDSGSALYQCRVAEDGQPIQITASALEDSGSKRTGWVYGALVLPYKYHFHDKSFGSSATIGPYLGRRSTVLDTGYTWAVSAGMTPITLDKVDATGNAVGTETVAAFTMAAGLLFEVNKSTDPLKVGLFFGQDRVGKDRAKSYTHNGKWWMAFQIGWDLTK